MNDDETYAYVAPGYLLEHYKAERDALRVEYSAALRNLSATLARAERAEASARFWQAVAEGRLPGHQP